MLKTTDKAIGSSFDQSEDRFVISLQSCPLICEQLLSRYFLNLAFLCAFCFNHIFCSTKCFALLKERCPFRAIVTKSQEHTVTGVCSISSQCVNTLSIYFFSYGKIAIQVHLMQFKFSYFWISTSLYAATNEKITCSLKIFRSSVHAYCLVQCECQVFVAPIRSSTFIGDPLNISNQSK